MLEPGAGAALVLGGGMLTSAVAWAVLAGALSREMWVKLLAEELASAVVVEVKYFLSVFFTTAPREPESVIVKKKKIGEKERSKGGCTRI